MTSEPSGRLYSAVTKHWPKVASALVVTLGIVELVAGGLTADSSIEFYLMAWAGMTGGLWFLFETAEKSLSEASREQVVSRLAQSDLKQGIAAIPSQFAFLFDQIFGEKHFTRRCFARSALASVSAAAVVSAVVAATTEHREFLWPAMVLFLAAAFLVPRWSWRPTALSIVYLLVYGLVFPLSGVAGIISGEFAAAWAIPLGAVLCVGAPRFRSSYRMLEWLQTLIWVAGWCLIVVVASAVAADVFFVGQGREREEIGATLISVAMPLLLFNLPLDYVSLLETRFATRWIRNARAMLPILLLDFMLSLAIWLALPAALLVFAAIGAGGVRGAFEEFGARAGLVFMGELFFEAPPGDPDAVTVNTVGMSVAFLTTFATSVWLWLYAASVLASRVLLKMNSGVGFLLRVTDVERQPFRSLGFVSVIIVSVLFGLGLPLVLV